MTPTLAPRAGLATPERPGGRASVTWVPQRAPGRGDVRTMAARAAPGSGGPMKRSVEHDHHDRAGGRHPHEAPPDHAARAAAEGHDDQAEPAGHAAHDAHADHAGHSPEAFRGRFWVSLLLTLPVLYLSEQLQAWFGYRAVSFPGSGWVNPLLGTALFLYGGLVFLRGARAELAARRPGMMTLVSLAITVAYAYSMAVAFGAPGMPFFWELGTLVVIMLLGHWLETASVQGASRALADLASLVPHV